jgi:hypothetical protein
MVEENLSSEESRKEKKRSDNIRIEYNDMNNILWG